jgi:chromosome partitioning protein
VAAQDLLVPIDARPFSLAGMNQLINLVDAIGKAFRHPVRLLGVLINLFDHTNLTEQICEQIRHRFGDKVFSTIVVRNIAISDAQLNQVPVMLHAPRSSGACNFRALAEEVLQRCNDIQAEWQWGRGR